MSIAVTLPQAHLPHATRAVEGAQWIDSFTHYQDVVGHLLSQSMVGIDTEFVRERTYYPQPGLVQLSDGEHVWLIDVVTLTDHQPLHQLLSDPKITKVLHSVGEDLEVLSLLTGHQPEPLFDTQWAAALLGFPFQLRYEYLVEMAFQVTLPGGQARSNWRQRPLGPQLLSYAAQDVIYLPELARILRAELEALGRLHWLEEDCARILNRRHEPMPPLFKVKGVGRLTCQAMAYADALSQWRDQQAKSSDSPRSFIMKDELLLELSNRAQSLGAAEAIRSVQAQLKQHADSCYRVLKETDPEGFKIPIALTQLSAQERELLKRWQANVALLAERLNLDPSVIASKRELTRLLRNESPDWLNGWRWPYLKNQLDFSDLPKNHA